MFPSRTTRPAACPTFADAFDPRRNAFAFLRMVLAVMVMVSHSFALGGFGRDPLARFTDDAHDFGGLAVATFFLLSGFLITRSSLGAPGVGRFLWHRFLRIFPGYWVCLLVTAFLFSPLFALIKGAVFSPDGALAYVRGNWAMFHLNGFGLPEIMNIYPSVIGSVLKDNPHPWSINGSLWSLPFECACYVVLALFSLIGGLRRGRFGVVILFAVLWAVYAFSCLDPESFGECFPYRFFRSVVFLGAYFSAGCLCYLYRKSIPASKILFAACVILLVVGLLCGSFGLVAPVAMSYAVMCLAFWLPIQRFDARGDFSYGTYIYAFPVQQGLVLLGMHHNGVVLLLISSVFVTLPIAALSYHLIEARSLRWKNIDFSRWLNRRPLAATPVTASALALLQETHRSGRVTSS